MLTGEERRLLIVFSLIMIVNDWRNSTARTALCRAFLLKEVTTPVGGGIGKRRLETTCFGLQAGSWRLKDNNQENVNSRTEPSF